MSDDRFYARLFAVVLLATIAIAVIALMRPFAGPICWALLLAFVLQPLNVWVRRKFHDRRGLAALAITLITVLVVALPASSIIVAFINQASQLEQRVVELSKRGDLRHLPAIQNLSGWLTAHFSVSVDGVFAYVSKNISKLLSAILVQGEAILVGILGTGAGTALMFFILFFALRGGDQAAARFIDLLPLREDHKKSLVNQMSAVTRATVLGAVVVALVQGFLVGFSFLVTGLPSPVVFGVIASLASLVPLGGTALVWGPGAIVLAAQGKWGAAIFVVVWGVVVVATADNLIRPRFVSGRSQVPTLGVFLGVLGGIPLFGLIGAFLGPIIIALALALLRFAQEERGLHSAR
jgi:predicted PurR-regulated permease PerM